MANIQYPTSGIYTVDFHAEDDCGNRQTGTRTINVQVKQYTISFDSKGGSVVASINVNEGDTATNFPTPTKAGYGFKGWYDNEYCVGDAITQITEVEQDYTLYAKWGDEVFSTIMFTDRTLAINVPQGEKQTYIDAHGAIISEMPGLDTEHPYIFATAGDRYWHGFRGNIDRVIIASPIKPTDMSQWFNGFYPVRIFEGASNIDTSRCTSLYKTFYEWNDNTASGLALDFSTWDVSNVTNFKLAFYRCNCNALDVSSWVTSSATDMEGMFQAFQIDSTVMTLDLSTFDFSNVTTMASMFASAIIRTLYLGNPDTSNCETFLDMFNGCTNLRTIYSDDFDLSSQFSSGEAMFSNSTNIIGGNGTAYNSSKVRDSMAVVDKPGREGYFTAPTYVTVHFEPNDGLPSYDQRYTTGTSITLPVPVSTTGKIFVGWHEKQDLSDSAFSTITLYNSITLYGEWRTDVPDTHMLFKNDNYEYTLVLSIPDEPDVVAQAKSMYGDDLVITWRNTADGSELWQAHDPGNYKGVIDRVVPWGEACSISKPMEAFQNLTSVSEIDLRGLEPWQGNPANMTNLSRMFYDDMNLHKVLWSDDIIPVEVSCVSMYQGCIRLEGDSTGIVQAPPVASITDASSMFCDCTNIPKIVFNDETKFDSCVYTSGMFLGCSSMTELHLPDSFRTEVNEDCWAMFNECALLTTIDNLEGLMLTPNANEYDLSQLFMGCKKIGIIQLPLFTMDVSKITSFASMFQDCEMLEQIVVPASFNLTSTTVDATYWSANCYRLSGQSGIQWDASMESDRSYCKTGMGGLFREYM